MHTVLQRGERWFGRMWRPMLVMVVAWGLLAVLPTVAVSAQVTDPPIKEPIRGLMNRSELLAIPAENPNGNNNRRDRLLALEGIVEDFTLGLTWAELENSDGTFNFAAIDDVLTELGTRNLARPGAEGGMRLRILAGTEAPSHVLDLAGGPVSIHAGSGAIGSGLIGIPRFWEPAVQAEYRDLHLALGERYDDEPLVREIVMSLCTTQFAEPMIRSMYVSDNSARYAAAGLTRASDLACHQTTFDIHAEAWPTTPSTFSINPYQSPDPADPFHDAATSLVVAESCLATLGTRCVLANNSILERRYVDATMNPDRAVADEAMFDLYDGLRWHAGQGVHIALQTATDARLQTGGGWFDQGTPAEIPAAEGQYWAGTLEAALCIGAGSVELPREYARTNFFASYEVSHLAAYDLRLEDPPLPAGTWCPLAFFPDAEPDGPPPPPPPPPTSCAGRPITVDLSAGDVPTEGDDVILGTEGPDVIDALGGNDVVCAQGGDDEVDGGPGADILHGRSGNDIIRGGDGSDAIDGGGGVDLCEISALDTHLGNCETIENPGSPPGSLFCDGRVVTVDIGAGQLPTEGDDVILGTDGADVIDALGGDDIVCAGDGDDFVIGGSGADVLFGEDGVDGLHGRGGPDRLDGGRLDGKTDRLHGGGGNDTCVYGTGDIDLGSCEVDIGGGLACVGRAITVDLSAGDVPTEGNDVILGTPGPDTIDALGGNDVVCGGGGDDVITGGEGNDRLFGDGGADTIDAGPGDDVVHGKAGRDVLIGGEGADLVHGGGGLDTCHLDALDTNEGGCETLS